MDIDYGQWGLHILSPRACAARTAEEQAARTGDFDPCDLIVGEFLGDQDLLVMHPQTNGSAMQVLVALPLYGRPDWFNVGSSLEEFLRQYLVEVGEKFWE
jgi:hypothetical protein